MQENIKELTVILIIVIIGLIWIAINGEERKEEAKKENIINLK